MHPYLRPGSYGNNIFCYLSEDRLKIYCHGKYIIQDYIARTLSLSFGHRCGSSPRSLQGLTYDIIVSNQSNRTSSCVQGIKHHCVGYYQHATFPNLIGIQTLDESFVSWKKFYLIVKLLITKQCYQHLWEIMCHVNFPKCDPKDSTSNSPLQ